LKTFRAPRVDPLLDVAANRPCVGSVEGMNATDPPGTRAAQKRLGSSRELVWASVSHGVRTRC